MYKILTVGFLVTFFILSNCIASDKVDDFIQNQYSVAKEIEMYTGLDLSFSTEDLRSFLLEGDKAKIMVRFDIQQEKYEDLVKINENKLSMLERVSPDTFRQKLAEYRQDLPDRGWFWELPGYEEPFWVGESSLEPMFNDAFAVSIREKMLRVILVCDRVNKVELSEQVMFYTGLELPVGAENVMCEVVQYDRLHDLGKAVYIRFELGNDKREEIAEILTQSRLIDINYFYDTIISEGNVPEWWEVEKSEQLDMNVGEERKYGNSCLVPDGNAYFIPIRSGGNRFYLRSSINLRQKNERERIEGAMGVVIPGEIKDLKTDYFSSYDGDFIQKARFDTTQQHIIEALNKSSRISFKYSDLKEDRNTLETACNIGYADEALKVEFWQEQLGLTNVICAMGPEHDQSDAEPRKGRYYIGLQTLDSENIRVYLMYYGAVSQKSSEP